MTLKEKWQSYDARIEDLNELEDLLREQKRKCECNIDHSYANDVWVKNYLNGEEIDTIKSVDEFNQFMEEGANYIADCVTDIFFGEDGYESDEEEAHDEEREATFEILWYNVVQMYCKASYDALDELIDDVENQRHSDCISPYRSEYENAKDDIYYGYGYQFWYDGNGDAFDNEDDAKFIWHCAFNCMAEAD